MSTPKNCPSERTEIPTDLSKCLGVRRTMTLRRIIRQSGLPPEMLLDLALEMLDIASRRLSPSPVQRQAVGLGAARWRNVGPEERSEALQKVAQARWAKQRRSNHEEGNRNRK